MSDLLDCMECGGQLATYFYIAGHARWLCFTCAQKAKLETEHKGALWERVP